MGRLNRNKSSKGRASRNMFTGLVLTVVNRAAFNDKRKTRRKEKVSSTLPRNKTKKPMTNRTKSNFTSHCRIAAKKLLRRTCSVFPTRSAHARYSFRMIDRFLNWGDHGKPKSGKIKGRCQAPLIPGKREHDYRRRFTDVSSPDFF